MRQVPLSGRLDACNCVHNMKVSMTPGMHSSSKCINIVVKVTFKLCRLPDLLISVMIE